MNAFTAFKTRLASDPEFEQALLRFMILGSVLVYFAAHPIDRANSTGFAFLATSFALAVGILAAICLWPAASVSRRVLGMVADVGTITYGLFVLGDRGTILIWAYLFIVIGNGFRYGRLYLFLCQTLCLISFMSVLMFAPRWQLNLSVGLGWIITLLLVPLYVGALVQRMRDEHLKTEQALKECLERERCAG